MELVWVLTLPGVVCLLVLLAALERLGLSMRRRRSGSPVAAVGFDELAAVLTPAKHHELEQRQAERMRRGTHGDGAPPSLRIDLDRGVAYVPRAGA